MKKVKIFLLLIVMGLTISLGTSCFAKSKEYTGDNGITITLPSSFIKGEHINAQMLLQTNKICFMGNAEAKSMLGIESDKLDYYTSMVLSAAKKDVEFQTYNEDGVVFNYAYYSASVENQNFKYMLITKEGESKYYTMNFWTLEKNFDKYKDKMFEWAKTIKVE